MYIQNISPCAILGDKTLKEASTSDKLEVGHLRIFGFPLHIHVPKEIRTKMDPFGKKGTSFGYNETLNSYHIYVLAERKIEVLRDMIFDKETTF